MSQPPCGFISDTQHDGHMKRGLGVTLFLAKRGLERLRSRSEVPSLPAFVGCLGRKCGSFILLGSETSAVHLPILRPTDTCQCFRDYCPFPHVSLTRPGRCRSCHREGEAVHPGDNRVSYVHCPVLSHLSLIPTTPCSLGVLQHISRMFCLESWQETSH